MLKARLAHLLREPVFLVFIILSIAISVSAAFFAAEKQQAGFKLAVVSEDTGQLGERLILHILDIEEFSAKEMTRDKAQRLLQNDRLDALLIIRNNFSESLLAGEFRNTLEIFTSPSSQAPTTITEPIINGAMMLWMEEFATIRTREYLLERGREYNGEDESWQRDEMKKLWEAGAMIYVDKVELSGGAGQSKDDIPLNVCIKWYCALSMFYLLHAASWVLELNKSGLSERIRQANIPKWKLILSNCLPSLLVGIFGYLIAGTLGSLLTGVGLNKLFINLISVVIYLSGLIGMTLFVVSILKSSLSLIFIAPVLTFLSAVLSGLLVELPKLAYVLIWLSHALPGKWLALSLEKPLKYLPGAILCCVIWLGAGLLISIRDQKKSNKLHSI